MTEQGGEDRQTWLVFIYRVPQEPPGRRTYVWRQLRNLGASYLQQAAAILPNQSALRHSLVALQDRIVEYGGEASLLETISPDAAWEQETITRFNQARDAEYAELHENVERLEDEIARERRRSKFTFAELEDLEADWEKLVRWRERISARDFFEAPKWADTRVVLDRARTALDAYTERVYAQPDTPHDHPLPLPSEPGQAIPRG